MNVQDLLQKLAIQRPLFHSEADFQFAFAWLIQKYIPDAIIRLERPFHRNEHSSYLDIWVSLPQQNYAIELKYKTCKTAVEIDGEKFYLRNHSAQDLGSYDVLKDVQRLEYLASTRVETTGYCIFITNDAHYWKPGKKVDAIATQFRLYDQQTISGKLVWGEKASRGTTKGREDPINLSGCYHVNWNDYSEIASPKNSRFRYLLFDISPTT